MILDHEMNNFGRTLSKNDLKNLSVNDQEVINAYEHWLQCKNLMRTSTHVIYPSKRKNLEVKMRISIIKLVDRIDANKIFDDLNTGSDFTALARKYSIGQGKEKGGDMGYLTLNELSKELPEEVIDVAFSLKVGKFSGIVESNESYYIILKNDEKILFSGKKSIFKEGGFKFQVQQKNLEINF